MEVIKLFGIIRKKGERRGAKINLARATLNRQYKSLKNVCQFCSRTSEKIKQEMREIYDKYKSL